MSSQMVLGLDLAKTSLPDAIAAMVEAWYEAQNTEIETQSAELKDLEQFIDQVMAQVVDWKDGKGKARKNSIAELFAIRRDQMIGSRSNASYALHECGLSYRGGHDDTVRVKWVDLPIILTSNDDINRLKEAFLACPEAKYFAYDESVRIPAKFFLDKLSS